MCLTPACLHAASELLYTLSPQYKTLDPCTNLEELVCGGWKDRHDIRADQTRTGTFQTISEASQLLLRHILEAAAPPSNETADLDNFSKIKTAYDACLDESAIKALGPAPLTNLLRQVTELYPGGAGKRRRAEAANATDIAITLRFLKQYKIEPFLSVYTSPDDKIPDNMVAYAAPAGLTLPNKERYQEATLFNKLKDTIAKVLPALLPGHTFTNATLSGVADFEKNLATIYPERKDLLDITVSEGHTS